MNTKIIKLDINKPVYGTILAKQGDTQSRFLLFKLLDNSIPFNLTNRTVRVYAIKPDGTEVFNDLVVNDTDKGYCTLELTSQMLALAGIVKMELVVTELDKKLTSIPFDLEVLPSINSDNAIVSTNEFTALINGLASLSEYDNYKNEISEARKGHETVGERLDNFDSQLENMVQLENFELVNKTREKKALLTFTFDDGYTQDITDIMPIFKSKGVTFSAAIVTSKVGTNGYMTYEQLKELQNNGFEVASHTHNHLHLTDLSDLDLDYELSESKSLLIQNGLQCRNVFIPYGFYDDRVKKHTKKYYRSARISGSAIKGLINYVPLETFHINSATFGDNNPPSGDDTIDGLKQLIDEAVLKGGWLILIAHSRAIIQNNRVNEISTLIDYAKSKNVEIVNYNEGLNICGNISESGNYNYNNTADNDRYKEYDHFVQGADGTVFSNRINSKFQKSNIFFDTKIDKFDMNCVTITPIYTANATNFPEGKAGVLFTHRWTRENAFCYQVYKILGKNTEYIRYALSDNSWASWFNTFNEELSNRYNYFVQDISVNHTPNDIRNNYTLYSNIQTANANGYPENSAGYLTCNKYGGAYTFAYEEYRVYKSSRIYVRFAESGTTWTDWMDYQEQDCQIVGINEYTSSTLPNALPKNKIISFAINTANAIGLPNNKAGIVTHNSVGSVWNFYFQDYVGLGETSTYRRISTDGTTWGSWIKITV